MGSWGSGSFDNDDALDWANYFLCRADTLGPVQEALTTVLEWDGYLQVDDGNYAVAAAEVLAALHGAPDASLPEDVSEWIEAHPFIIDESLRMLALQALERVEREPDSEVAELWAGSDDWQNTIDHLKTRLRT